MYESSSIQLSKTALLNNLKFIKKRLKKDVTLCSVVKGNAYGHGLKEFVNIAHQLGINYFGVHSADEAYYLKTVVQLPYNLFIMGNIANQAIEWAIENNVEFVVFDLEQLHEVIHICEKLNKTAKIHIEIETGMRRTGFEPEQLSQVFSILLKKKTLIELIGVFTHFAGAESLANQFRIQAQIKVFKLAVAAFKSKKLNPKYVHAACSAAMLNYPETQFDMVRIGILQYGFWPNSETHIKFCGEKESNPDLLKRVIKWTSKVMALKEVKKAIL